MSVDGPNTERLSSGRDEYDQLVAATQKRHRLLAVHWELTYRCNERCSHCYLDVLPPGASTVGELTTVECKRILDELASEGTLNVSFSGGEIFVRKDWYQVLSYARQRGFAIRIFTNATLITPEIADQVQSLHPFMVESSVYGADADTHDRITRLPGSWAKTMCGIRLLRERQVRIKMKTPLMRENVHQFDELSAMAERLGAIWNYDFTITPRDNGRVDNVLRHSMTDEQLLEIFRSGIDTDAFAFAPSDPNVRTCAITQNSLVIDPYGQIYPCVQVREPAGNLRHQPLREIWNNASVWQQLGNLTIGELPVCSSCELRTFCVRCHGLARMESGDIRAPALANCREALVRRRALIEKGLLPPDYPIPMHLKDFVLDVSPAENFIPLSVIRQREPVHTLNS